MIVKVRTKDTRFTIPVPVVMAGFCIKLLPERLFIELQSQTPQPYRCLVTKEYIRMILDECIDILKCNKGLEIIHVEAADGTFVSIKL